MNKAQKAKMEFEKKIEAMHDSLMQIEYDLEILRDEQGVPSIEMIGTQDDFADDLYAALDNAVWAVEAAKTSLEALDEVMDK